MKGWSKMGRHLVADWDRGTMQVIRDDKDGARSFKYQVYDNNGALVCSGRKPTLASAQRTAAEWTMQAAVDRPRH